MIGSTDLKFEQMAYISFHDPQAYIASLFVQFLFVYSFFLWVNSFAFQVEIIVKTNKWANHEQKVSIRIVFLGTDKLTFLVFSTFMLRAKLFDFQHKYVVVWYEMFRIY